MKKNTSTTNLRADIEEFMRENKQIKDAVDTLVKLLKAAQGTLTDGDSFGFEVSVENGKQPQLNGKYRITIEEV